VETTERIVEAYVRYVKRWATIPNIKCRGQNEIDLLAIDPASFKRYHIEVGVSISGSYSKLTDKPFSIAQLKQRVTGPGQRRTVGFFVERKFGLDTVLETLALYGFTPGNYRRVIVSWGWTDGAAAQAKAHGIDLWDFPRLLREITDRFRHVRAYFTDDTLRTLQLYERSMRELGALED